MENTIKTSKKPTAGSNNKDTMRHSHLMKLFEDELREIYWAENTLLIAIPKMIKNATSRQLNQSLSFHLEETKEHVARLEEVFSLIEVKAVAIKCDAMEGLLREASDILESCEKGCMLDAGIISSVQKIEHYEIATYGTLREFADTLGLTKVVDLLESTLQEEKEADMELSDVAMDAINIEAAE